MLCFPRAPAAALTAALLFAACAPDAPTALLARGAVSAASVPSNEINCRLVRCPTPHYLYVGNGSSITVFVSSATGNVSPVTTIKGGNTGLATRTSGVAVGNSGSIYVATGTRDSGAVEVFAPNALGNVSPVATIAGPKTGLDFPNWTGGVTVDASETIYVLSNFPGDVCGGDANVEVYAPGATGNVSPNSTIFVELIPRISTGTHMALRSTPPGSSI